MSEVEINSKELVNAILSAIEKSIEVKMQGYLFYFKECLNDMLADMAVINHEVGLLRRHLEMEKDVVDAMRD